MHRTAFLFLLASGVAAASVPTTATHQGRLLDPAGGPLEGEVDLTVSLWDSASSGSRVWQETFNDVLLEDGYFSVVLGEQTPLTDALLTDSRWIQLNVDDAPPLGRQPLGSTPFALVARGVNGGVVNASEIRVDDRLVVDSDGQVTPESLPGGTIPSGAVMHFDLDSCPAGWSPLTAAYGRTIVGSTGGNRNTTSGEALASGGTRSISEVPRHTHRVDPPSTASTAAGAHSHTVDPPSAASSNVANHTHSVNPAPVNSSTISNHNHTVDPGAVSTTSDTHNHSYNDIYWSENNGPVRDGGRHTGSNSGSDSDNYSWQLGRTTGSDTHNHSVNIPSTTSSASGAHNHSVDVAATTSTAAGGHGHTVDIPSFSSAAASNHEHAVDIAPFNTASTGPASVDVTMPYLQLLPCRRD